MRVTDIWRKTNISTTTIYKYIKMEDFSPQPVKPRTRKPRIADKTNEKLRRIYSLPISIDSGVMRPINMVCTKEDGDIMTCETFKYAARVIHYSLGLEFNFHSLRHTHATTLIENGANIKDVQDRLGHANI